MGMSTNEIAIWLNRSGIAPPYSGKRNKYGWSNNTVHRLVTSEIHLGYVIYGKTRNFRGTAQLVKKEDWIIAKGEHEQLKTEQEHGQIMARIAQNAIIPRKCRVGELPLSGLLYCSKCGRWMQFKRRVTKSGTYWIALCVYTHPDGTKCEQVGRKLDDAFYKVLYKNIIKIDEQTLETVSETNEQYMELAALVEIKRQELARTEQTIEKMLELYEDGASRFMKRLRQTLKQRLNANYSDGRSG